MPGIVMIGTAVSFYLIPVTDTLQEALSMASYPAQETVVFRFIPPVPDPFQYIVRSKGMRPLENRSTVLQCFEAFKKLLYQIPINFINIFLVNIASGLSCW